MMQGYIELSDSHTPDLKKNEMASHPHCFLLKVRHLFFSAPINSHTLLFIFNCRPTRSTARSITLTPALKMNASLGQML
jgi:hypothetical protein